MVLEFRSKVHPSVQDLFAEACSEEEAGRTDIAIAIYEKILRVDPDRAQAYVNLGTIRFREGDFDSAEEMYRKAVEIDPEYPTALFNLANVLDEQKRTIEAIATYKRAIEIAPRFADAHYNLALILELNGEEFESRMHWLLYLQCAAADEDPRWLSAARQRVSKKTAVR